MLKLLDDDKEAKCSRLDKIVIQRIHNLYQYQAMTSIRPPYFLYCNIDIA